MLAKLNVNLKQKRIFTIAQQDFAIMQTTKHIASCFITREIPFDKNGFYMFAQTNQINRPTFIQNLLKGSLIVCLAKVYSFKIIFGYLVYHIIRNLVKPSLYFQVSEIYLLNDMKRVMFKFNRPLYYSIIDINDISTCTRDELNDILNKISYEVKDSNVSYVKKMYTDQFPLLVKNKIYWVPLAINIRDKEILSAVSKGQNIIYSIDKEEKNKYIKLKTNDYTNYSI